MAIMPSTLLQAGSGFPTEPLDTLKNAVAVQVSAVDSVESGNQKNLLVVSPYDENPHLLDLTTLDIPNQSVAKALVGLKCLRADYATAPYVEIFNVSIS